MEMTNNTVLVTGGGSGIGRGLAEFLHRSGNTVIIAGRRRDLLRTVAEANPGMQYLHLDLTDPASIDQLTAELTGLNVLINNAGVMHAPVEATVGTNLLGPIRLTTAVLPTLLAQPRAAIVNVTSALAFVPKADAPTYSATKAALHSYTESLRHQLRDTSVEVIEVIPPQVETDMVDGQPPSANVMSLDSFVAESVSLLQTGATEIVVEAARRVRFAASDGRYDEMFGLVNP
jgi:uncharacterized oxidoreductase